MSGTSVSGNVDFSNFNTVLSFDLGWPPSNPERTAAAWWTRGEYVFQWSWPSAEIEDFACSFEGRVLIMLDIPIYESESLSSQNPFRGVDRALMSFGVPLLPSFMAGTRGLMLPKKIEESCPSARVIESYPFAVLRFLWITRDHPACLSGALTGLIDERLWRKEFPPAYKKGGKHERVNAMKNVLGTIGRFAEIEEENSLQPKMAFTHNKLNLLCDVYDALIVLIAGRKIVEGSPWAVLGKVEGSNAAMPLLMGENLQNKWKGIVSESVAKGSA
ncbi:MAG: hypothetical protein PHP64_01720 [Actinomycetota bacterium]|nr:hypothetical protein [Actinomycetota bacterium]